MRLSWGSDLNTHPIKYLPIEDDYGCVPRDRRTRSTYHYHWAGAEQRVHHMPSICLPRNCGDIDLASPLLMSYT